MNTLIKLEEAALLYGLKYTDHFKHTHLGWIGQKGPFTNRSYSSKFVKVLNEGGLFRCFLTAQRSIE